MIENMGPPKYEIVISHGTPVPPSLMEKILKIVFNREDSLILANLIESGEDVIAGSYIYEIADIKCEEAIYIAKVSGYVLHCSILDTSEV